MVEEVTEAARTIGVPSGDPLCVVSVAWKESSLASRLPAGPGRDVREFGRISVISISHKNTDPYIREAVVFALSATEGVPRIGVEHRHYTHNANAKYSAGLQGRSWYKRLFTSVTGVSSEPPPAVSNRLSMIDMLGYTGTSIVGLVAGAIAGAVGGQSLAWLLAPPTWTV